MNLLQYVVVSHFLLGTFIDTSKQQCTRVSTEVTLLNELRSVDGIRGDTFVSTFVAMRCNLLEFLDARTLDMDVFRSKAEIMRYIPSASVERMLLKHGVQVDAASSDVDDRGASDVDDCGTDGEIGKPALPRTFEGAVVEEDGALESKVGHHAETRSTASSTDSCPKSIAVRSALPTAYAYVAHHCQCFSHRSQKSRVQWTASETRFIHRLLLEKGPHRVGSHAISMGRLSKEQVQNKLSSEERQLRKRKSAAVHISIAVAHESTARASTLAAALVKYARTMVVEVSVLRAGVSTCGRTLTSSELKLTRE